MPANRGMLCCCALLLLCACQSSDFGGPLTQQWKCVNQVMGSDAQAPVVVILTDREFHQRFGSQYDGWYDGGNDTVYLSSHRDNTLLPHELAHHVQHQEGRYLNEAQSREVARLCS